MKKYSNDKILNERLAEFDHSSDRAVAYIINDLKWNVDDRALEYLREASNGMAKLVKLLEERREMARIENEVCDYEG